MYPVFTNSVEMVCWDITPFYVANGDHEVAGFCSFFTFTASRNMNRNTGGWWRILGYWSTKKRIVWRTVKWMLTALFEEVSKIWFVLVNETDFSPSKWNYEYLLIISASVFQFRPQRLDHYGFGPKLYITLCSKPQISDRLGQKFSYIRNPMWIMIFRKTFLPPGAKKMCPICPKSDPYSLFYCIQSK